MTESTVLAALQTRIDNLEMKVSFQDDIIEKLNQEIAVHNDQLSDVNDQLRLIGQRVKDMNSSPVGRQEDETPPPHY